MRSVLWPNDDSATGDGLGDRPTHRFVLSAAAFGASALSIALRHCSTHGTVALSANGSVAKSTGSDVAAHKSNATGAGDDFPGGPISFAAEDHTQLFRPQAVVYGTGQFSASSFIAGYSKPRHSRAVEYIPFA